MNKTPIEWALNPDGTQGYTWNPITGCLNGCEYCYARKLATTRLKERYLANKNWNTKTPQTLCHDHYPNLDPFYPRFWPERLALPEPPTFRNRFSKEVRFALQQNYRKGIFVCDMSDLFGIGIPEEWTQRVMSEVRMHPEHRFYLLTKQPQNLIKFSPFPDNCWVGVTATDNVMFHTARHRLEFIEAGLLYVSFEPLLERIKIDWTVFLGGIKWVIIGSQTRPTIMPKIEWVKEIVHACDKAGIPVFLKDNLGPLLAYDDMELRQEMPQ